MKDIFISLHGWTTRDFCAGKVICNLITARHLFTSGLVKLCQLVINDIIMKFYSIRDIRLPSNPVLKQTWRRRSCLYPARQRPIPENELYKLESTQRQREEAY